MIPPSFDAPLAGEPQGTKTPTTDRHRVPRERPSGGMLHQQASIKHLSPDLLPGSVRSWTPDTWASCISAAGSFSHLEQARGCGEMHFSVDNRTGSQLFWTFRVEVQAKFHGDGGGSRGGLVCVTGEWNWWSRAIFKVGDRPVPVIRRNTHATRPIDNILGEGDHVWIGQQFAKPLTHCVFASKWRTSGCSYASRKDRKTSGTVGEKSAHTRYAIRVEGATMYLRAGVRPRGVRHLQAILGHPRHRNDYPIRSTSPATTWLADHAQYSPMRTLGLAERPYRRST